MPTLSDDKDRDALEASQSIESDTHQYLLEGANSRETDIAKVIYLQSNRLYMVFHIKNTSRVLRL